MPLSEEDQRRLAEIENALHREDPDFAAAIAAGRVSRARLVGFCLMFVAGAAVLVGGLVTTHAFLITGMIIAVIGIAAMAGAAGYIRRELRG